MAFTANHIRITWGGRLFDVETWSCGLRMTNGDSNPALLLGWAQNYLDATRDAIGAWWTYPGLGGNTGAMLDWVKVQPVSAADGRYFPGHPTVEYSWRDAGTAQAGNGSLSAAQLAIVVSMQTAVRRGRGSHGRIYIPSGHGIAPDGRMPASDVAVVSTATANLIATLNAMDNPGLGTSIAVMSKIGAGTTNDVTTVGTGRVIDTQRRRRRSLAEERVQVPVPFIP